MTNQLEDLKNRINLIEMGPLTSEDMMRDQLVASLDSKMKVLDCGKSLRHKFNDAAKIVAEIKTLDINKFNDYPDYLVDICKNLQTRSLRKKFDIVITFSLLEHTYDPFAACQNLFSLTKVNGQIVGSAPFLFPRHAPKDLSYQDYFRFTRDAYAVLFPNAKKITLFPLRGRLATSLNVLTLRYRFILEKTFPRLGNLISKALSSGDHAFQVSGYGFIIQK